MSQQEILAELAAIVNDIAGVPVGDVTPEKTSDGFAVLLGNGGMEVKRVVTRGIRLPAEACDRESLAQEPRIAGIVLDVPVTAIHERDDAAMAAVGVFEENRAIAAVWVFGADRDEVCGELDLVVVKIDGVLEVDNSDVVRIVGS